MIIYVAVVLFLIDVLGFAAHPNLSPYRFIPFYWLYYRIFKNK